MGDFNPVPGVTNLKGQIGTAPNMVAPGKRMLSSMTPTIVLKHDRPFLLIGSPGGISIINTVAQVIVNVVDFEMDIAEAIGAARIHHQWLPDELKVERFGFSPDTLRLLRDMGHKIRPFDTSRSQGRAMGIMIDPGNRMVPGRLRSSQPGRCSAGLLVQTDCGGFRMSAKPPPSPGFHLSPEEFRRHGHEAIEWIARYMETVESFPVLSQVEPGQIRSQLPDSAPQTPDSMEEILTDIDRIIIPGVTHWQSPGFFAFFPGNTSPPSILGELLSSALGVQGMLWVTSPACTELETHVLDWLAKMLDLPERFLSQGAGGGMLQDSASSATLCALLAARERKTRGRTNETGLAGSRPLVAYGSTETHSSLDKAVRVAGIGLKNLRKIDVNENFSMKPELSGEGHPSGPCKEPNSVFCVCHPGNDFLHRIRSRGRGRLGSAGKYGLWLHVDAAMSGTAAICPEFRWLNDGLEFADSYCFNPHKWMFVNFDCTCFYTADREDLIRTFSVVPEYLRNPASDSGDVIDYRDWQIPLGRRFRALKLWFCHQELWN